MINLDNQIREIEKSIKIKERLGKDTRFEYALINAYKEFLEKNPDGELDKDLLYNASSKPYNKK